MTSNQHEFNDEQRLAIDYGTDTSRRLVAISGPAGTGKTTIIQRTATNLSTLR